MTKLLTKLYFKIFFYSEAKLAKIELPVRKL